MDPAEQCDGAALNGADCTSVGFYFAPGLACRADCTFDTSACAGRCGDGVLDDTEQCEGNNIGDRTCLTLGFSGGTLACDAQTCALDTSGCTGECGNGAVEGEEECDDDGREPDDGCSPGCLIESGWDCNGVPSYCEPICGDGVVVGAEVCDGEEVGEDTCDTLGFYSGTITCEADCSAIDTSGCSGRCGDGVVDTGFGEDCDGADLAGATCGTLGLAGTGLACDSTCHYDDSTCTRWVSVTCGTYHSCALDSGGAVWCWGNAMPSGNEPEGPPHLGITVPTRVNLVSTATQVAAGSMHTCAILSNGSLWCWGVNNDYQLGAGVMDSGSYAALPVVGLGSGVSRVSLGDYFSCAIKDGDLYCWGSNGNGQLADGTTQTRQTAQLVNLPGADVIDVASGGVHTCAINADGALFCWGASSDGQLGLVSTDNQLSPSQIGALDDLVRIEAGWNYTCGLKSDGSVWCWGGNFWGQLGDGTTTGRYTPQAIISLGTGVLDIASPAYYHNCFVKSDGTAWCTGYNGWGQLGNGSGGGGSASRSSNPVPVSGLTAVRSIGAGEVHSCAVTAAGTLWCWGANDHGQLGNPTVTVETNVPVMVQAP